jgi:hypothetical protein
MKVNEKVNEMPVTYWISWLFAVALAHHLEVDHDGLVDTHRVDLERLTPFPRILRALHDFDLG